MRLFRCFPSFTMLQSSQSASTRVLRLKSAFICSCCSHVSQSSPWKCCHFQILCALFPDHLICQTYQVWGEAGNIRFMPGILRGSNPRRSVFGMFWVGENWGPKWCASSPSWRWLLRMYKWEARIFLLGIRGVFDVLLMSFYWISSEVLGDLDVI